MQIELTEKEAKIVVYSLRNYADKIVPYVDNCHEGYEICRDVEKRIVRQYVEGMNNTFKNHENLKVKSK